MRKGWAFPIVPLGIFKLAVLLIVVFFPLSINRRRETGSTVYTELTGEVKIQHLLGILLMPVMAVCVYALAVSVQLSEESIRAMSEDLFLVQSIVRAMIFVWAFLTTLWSGGQFVAELLPLRS